MTIRPLCDRVVVRCIEPEDRTNGGVLIPDAAREKALEGEVLAVGPGVRNENGALQPLDLSPGDRILFIRRSGVEVTIDGKDLLILKQSDVMAVLENAGAVKQAAWPRARLA